MAISSYLPMLVYPIGIASAGLLGFAIGVERILLFAFIGVTVAIAYRCRWLMTMQQPSHNAQMWGWVTIPQGEDWNICLTTGELQTVSGPDVVRIWGATLLKLVPFSGTHSQYLAVQFVDGRSEIIPGPAQVYKDCSVHKDIKVKDAVNLTDSEVLVVYRDDSVRAPGKEEGTSEKEMPSQGVSRHIIRGPCLYVPKNATEWTHQFCWHGSALQDMSRRSVEVEDVTGRKVKNALKFTKLRVCPEQTYFDVEGVRTKDDALVTVKVMIFYRLQDIDTLLKETHDPIADFINSVTSDVIEFVSGSSFEEFKAASDQLNDLNVYQQLTSRAKGIGFEVTKVVFRGYGAPPRLQKMHDDAIERRTKLALERDTEDQEQRMLDMKLEHEETRLRKRRQMETETKEHERMLQRAAHEATQKEMLEQRQAQVEHLDSLRSSLNISSEQLASYLLASESYSRPLAILISKATCLCPMLTWLASSAQCLQTLVFQRDNVWSRVCMSMRAGLHWKLLVR